MSRAAYYSWRGLLFRRTPGGRYYVWWPSGHPLAGPLAWRRMTRGLSMLMDERRHRGELAIVGAVVLGGREVYP